MKQKTRAFIGEVVQARGENFKLRVQELVSIDLHFEDNASFYTLQRLKFLFQFWTWELGTPFKSFIRLSRRSNV